MHRARFLIAASFVGFVLLACGGRDASLSPDSTSSGTGDNPSGTSSGNPSSSSSPSGTCDANGGQCLTQNAPGSKGNGPANCAAFGRLFDDGPDWVSSDFSCTEGQCCIPPVQEKCLSLPSQAPACSPGNVDGPVTFDARSDIETFLRGDWLICQFDSLPGGYTDRVGFEFSGADDTFAVLPLTDDGNAGVCDVVNQMSELQPTNLLITELQGSNTWRVSFQLHETAALVVGSIQLSPPRILFTNNIEMARVN